MKSKPSGFLKDLSYASQDRFDVRCEWGLQGLNTLQADSDVIIIVDVLSFTTSVEIATANGALVYPFIETEQSLEEFTRSIDGIAATFQRHAGEGGYSLAPSSLKTIPSGTRLVLPSPNGSVLSLSTGSTVTLAGCLRNAQAVAALAMKLGKKISVIPAGERWTDRSLRPGLEDWLGAGAILSAIEGDFSPEALAARQLFEANQDHLAERIAQCSSGRELFERGFAEDVELAAELNCSQTAPILENGAYIAKPVA